MNEIRSKYAMFIDLLLQKTKESKITWKYDSDRDEISVWHNKTLLTVKKSLDENFEDSYSVSLFNDKGDYLEGFNEDLIMGIPTDVGSDNYFIRLHNLFELAKRQATGADRALDDLIAAIKNDELQFPF